MTLGKRILYSALVPVIVVAVLETGLYSITFIKHRFTDRPEVGPISYNWLKHSPYEGAGWTEEYGKEHARISYGVNMTNYQPFYGWRRNGFKGRYINISKCGIRRTWNPPFKGDNEVKTVFCFGGSTVWGSGVRDEFTIPSLLSKKLNRSGGYHVINYGEAAYTVTQEIILLMLQLKEGNIPDYVVFYDGVNDIYAAYQNGKAGLTQNLSQVRDKLMEDTFSLSLLKRGLSGMVKEKSMLYRVAMRINSIVRKDKGIKGLAASAYDEERLSQLAQEIAQDYEKSLRLVDHLSKSYGFEYLFFWQPVMYFSEVLTPEEMGYADWKDEQMVKLYRLVYDITEEKNLDRFYNLTKVLDSKDETLYIDFCHLCEEGNGIIADEIFKLLNREFEL